MLAPRDERLHAPRFLAESPHRVQGAVDTWLVEDVRLLVESRPYRDEGLVRCIVQVGYHAWVVVSSGHFFF